MASYLIRRVIGAVPLVWGVCTLVFFVVHLAPGDPTAIYWNPDTDPQVIREMQHNLGLDRPLPEQYVRWLGRFLTGDFGHSFARNRPVSEVLAEALPNTLILSSVSLVILFTLGILAGTASAVRPRSLLDHAITLVSFFFYSMPAFWFALMLLLVFHYRLEWFPADQMHALDFEYDALPFLGRMADRVRHIVLPATALGLGATAGVARYTRASLLDVIRMDYIRTARAKGLPESRVIFRHALRNALIPVVTLVGLYLPFLFSGAVLVETIFGWPGMGRVIVTAIFQRDYPLVMANAFLMAVLVIAANLAADLAYSFVDPRIRHGGEER
ncbi:MAG: ABC transporter permease [Candidatus Eisenbacteria bacterium]|nr:ABC transporter permease [Candidatus Eisenbacteria bacterium]